MKKITLLILIIIILISCSNTHKKEYYKTGKLMKEYTLNYSNQYNGIYQEYYENGKIMVDMYFKNGNFEGLKKGYYENGNIKYSCEGKDGRLNGYLKRYNESKELTSIEYYKNDSIVFVQNIEKGLFVEWSQSVNLDLNKEKYSLGEQVLLKTSIYKTFIKDTLDMVIYIATKFADKKWLIIDEYKSKYMPPKEISFKSKALDRIGEYNATVKIRTKDPNIIFQANVPFDVK